MGYRFASGVYACRADGQLVVLNTRADRYLLLPPPLDACLTRLIRGEAEQPGDKELLARLCTGSLVLERTGASKPRLCDHPFPDRSMLDLGWRSSGLGDLAAAATKTAWSMFSVRHLGLARALRGVTQISPQNADDIARVERIVAGFAALRLAIPAFDRCLPLSLALAASAKHYHAHIRLVLGVKCNPFAAHAWAQLDRTLLNDRLDAVRAFTPILAL